MTDAAGVTDAAGAQQQPRATARMVVGKLVDQIAALRNQGWSWDHISEWIGRESSDAIKIKPSTLRQYYYSASYYQAGPAASEDA